MRCFAVSPPVGREVPAPLDLCYNGITPQCADRALRRRGRDLRIGAHVYGGRHAKQRKIVVSSILDARLGAWRCRPALLEHRESVVQYLRVCKDREGSDHHFMDGCRIRTRDHDRHLPVRHALRPDRQAKAVRRGRLYPVGAVHDPVRHNGVHYGRRGRLRQPHPACRDCGRACGCAHVVFRLYGQRFRLQRLAERRYDREERQPHRRGACHTADHRHDRRYGRRRPAHRQQR